MEILRKAYGILRGMLYRRYTEPEVVIRDYGTTYFLLSKNCILGSGKLIINANAIDHREYSKIRMGGGKAIHNGNGILIHESECTCF